MKSFTSKAYVRSLIVLLIAAIPSVAHAGFGDFAKKVVDAAVSDLPKSTASAETPAAVKQSEEAVPLSSVTFSSLPSGMKDPQLEKEIFEIASAKDFGKSTYGSVKKLKIKSRAWDIQRNEMSGIIKGRALRAYLYVVAPDGKCFYQSVGFAQDYDGAKYFNTYYDGFYSDEKTYQKCE